MADIKNISIDKNGSDKKIILEVMVSKDEFLSILPNLDNIAIIPTYDEFFDMELKVGYITHKGYDNSPFLYAPPCNYKNKEFKS